MTEPFFTGRGLASATDQPGPGHAGTHVTAPAHRWVDPGGDAATGVERAVTGGTAVHGYYDLGGEEEDGGVQEGRQLTLVAWVCSVVAEELERRRNRARRPLVGGGKTRKDATIPSVPARFLG